MYIGRFAPSPTGALHFGSLLAALASYLDAKSHAGKWLLRIDDLDPPREMLGASRTILDTLQSFGLQWDAEVIYQSERHHLYQAALDQLKTAKLSYPCNCSRKDIQHRTGSNQYDRHCLSNPVAESEKQAWRFKNNSQRLIWTDGILGQQNVETYNLADFILQRSDSLWAYQLAVTVDDATMGITHIVRGSDLLLESAKQILLIEALQLPSIHFSHIPLVKNSIGQKLSKQNLAQAISAKNVSLQLYTALEMLGQRPHYNLKTADKHDILQQATVNWAPENIPQAYATTYIEA